MAFAGSQQKRTFLPYTRGILPEHLRLGSLYINPLDPIDDLPSTRCKYMGDNEDQEEYEEAVSKWSWKRAEVDRPFSIDFEASKARSTGITFTDLLNLNGTSSDNTRIEIHGQSGRRVRLKNSEAFLEEVMKQPGVHKWIREHASVEYNLTFNYNWKAPKIWMVTALQYVIGGKIHTLNGESNKIVGGAGVAAPSGAFDAHLEGSFEHSNETITDFGHEEERVWAAQFMPVTIRFGPEEDGVLSPYTGKPFPRTITSFRLREVPDLRNDGVRSRGYEATAPVPKLIARVTVHRSTDNHEEEVGEEEDRDFVIDDSEYVANKMETNWKQYDKCKALLREEEEEEELED